MRAVTFLLAFSLAAFAVVVSGSPSPAQTKPADETKAPQTLTGPGGSDKQVTPAAIAQPAESKAGSAGADAPKSAEKSSQDRPNKDAPAADKAANAKKPAGRVGTLSPGEARRAARARDRAAAARRDHVPQQAAQPSPPAPAVTTNEARAAGKPIKATARPSTVRDARAPETTKRRTAAEHHSRPSRDHAYAPRTRRNYAGPDREPRAGDVVPPGYPLYPLPPRGAGYYEVDGGPFRRNWRALPPPPRGYPPFPRLRYGDDDRDDE